MPDAGFELLWVGLESTVGEGWVCNFPTLSQVSGVAHVVSSGQLAVPTAASRT